MKKNVEGWGGIMTLPVCLCTISNFFPCACWQAAWAANDYSVQDTLDHEVYKMIGRHGTSMVSRGIVAAGSLHTTGIAGKRVHE